MFDEYFLKDLGSDQAIWVGEAGGKLRHFARKELRVTSRALLDLRLAVAQNLSAVRLKDGSFAEAIRWADAALVTALEVTPGDAETRRLLREAEAKRSPTW